VLALSFLFCLLYVSVIFTLVMVALSMLHLFCVAFALVLTFVLRV
jgi:hypothetical protein